MNTLQGGKHRMMKLNYDNTVIGHKTTSSEGIHKSVFIGGYAGRTTNESTTSGNTMVGYSAGRQFFGNRCTYIGLESGLKSTGSTNIFLGAAAGAISTGDNNIYIGTESGFNYTGSNNIFLGNNVDANANGKSYIFTVGVEGGYLLNGNMGTTKSLTINGTTTINSVLNLTPLATAPATPAVGAIYVNTNGHIYCFIGGTWKQLDN